MKLNLRTRFALICASLVALSMLAASIIWHYGVKTIAADAQAINAASIRSHAHADLERRARTISALLVENLANPMYFYDLYEIQTLLQPLLRESDVKYVIVFDPEGRVIHDGNPDIPSFGQTMEDPLAAVAIGATDLTVQRNAEVLEVAVPIRLGELSVGGVRLGLALDRVDQEVAEAGEALVNALTVEVQRRVDTLLALLALLLVVGGVLAVFVARNLVSPIKHLVRYTSRIEAGEYPFESDTGRSDEIGDLMRAFDRMSESVRRNTLEVRHIAYHDSLSGLPNRLMFREFLDQHLAEDRSRRQPVALLFLDLDDFKRVNDTLGHDKGDQLLVAFAERLRRCVMDPSLPLPSDPEAPTRLVARLGGDEFTVMLIGEQCKEAARQLAGLILAEVSKPFDIQNREFFVSTSIGITLHPDDANSADQLVKNADIAMYGAKLAGKNRYQFFHEKMVADADQRMEMESQLRQAVQQHEFEVFYQPIVRLSDEMVVGAEALLRWRHPERGELSPSVFIPLAEELGLIDVIGQQVLDIACQDLSRWPRVRDGSAPYVSVNLSGRQVYGDRIVHAVRRAIDQSRIQPEQLALELTENSLLESEEEASQVLQALRNMGVKVFLDDFGTGFSGLSHLRRIPVDGVKIDRSFVADILLDPDDLALTSAIIAMALSLNMGVIAEGVETEGQTALLQDQGCRLGQGFLFGRPMSNSSFVALLAASQPQNSRSA